MDLVLQHIPHIIPAAVGLLFLVRFGMYARRLPPRDLTDEQLTAWEREHSGHRRISSGVDPHDVQPSGSMGSANQRALDVGAAAGPGNQRHH